MRQPGALVSRPQPTATGDAGRAVEVLRSLGEFAAKSGIDLQAAADAAGIGLQCNTGSCGPRPYASGPRNMSAIQQIADAYVPQAWDSGSNCPQDVTRLLCWMWKGLCSFNTFASIGSVALQTNNITLPDDDFGFAIGPDGDATPLGIFFPRDWVSEAIYHGITELRVHFGVNIITGDLTPESVRQTLLDICDFRITQIGSEDKIETALNVGDAQQAQRSDFVPALGGFHLGRDRAFVPYALAPEVFAFDFRCAQAPGTIGTDSYSLNANIRTRWDRVC